MAPNPDAAFIRLCERHISNLEACNRTGDGGSDAEREARGQAYDKTMRALNNAKPKTLAGLLAKARAAVAEAAGQTPSFHGFDEQWAWEVMVGLLRLHGETH